MRKNSISVVVNQRVNFLTVNYMFYMPFSLKDLKKKLSIKKMVYQNLSRKKLKLQAKNLNQMEFIKKYLKWLSTFLVLTGILLTNLNIYPINIMFHGAGVVGWTIAGFLSKDKAILTNFGLQIPLFLIGFYQIIF